MSKNLRLLPTQFGHITESGQEEGRGWIGGGWRKVNSTGLRAAGSPVGGVDLEGLGGVVGTSFLRTKGEGEALRRLPGRGRREEGEAGWLVEKDQFVVQPQTRNRSELVYQRRRSNESPVEAGRSAGADSSRSSSTDPRKFRRPPVSPDSTETAGKLKSAGKLRVMPRQSSPTTSSSSSSSPLRDPLTDSSPALTGQKLLRKNNSRRDTFVRARKHSSPALKNLPIASPVDSPRTNGVQTDRPSNRKISNVLPSSLAEHELATLLDAPSSSSTDTPLDTHSGGSSCLTAETDEQASSSGDSDGEVDATVGRRRRKGRSRPFPKKLCVFLGYCNNTSLQLVRHVIAAMGWREVEKEADARFIWLDPSHGSRADLLARACRKQRVNFLPGMKEMCNKRPLYRLLNRMKASASEEDFFFFPKTWVLPEDWERLDEELRQKKPKTFIVKPDGGAQGTGIFLMRTGYENKLLRSDRYIVQRYVHRPLLLDGFKFDMRLYVLVTSVDPLRCFLHSDGLARFCTKKYVAPSKKNLEETMMHLTNYSLNKHNSEGFIRNDEEEGSKRSLSVMWEQVRAMGHDTSKAWESIRELCRRTMLTKLPHLWFQYHSTVTTDTGPSMAFQIIGVDVLLDHELRPWLLETNNGPSFNMDEEVDRDIKCRLVEEALTMVKTIYKQPGGGGGGGGGSGAPVTEEEVLQSRERRWQAHLKAQQWERKSLRDFQVLYDGEDEELDLLFPTTRRDVIEAFELAARVGDRERQGLRGLTPSRLAAALRHLNVLDGKRLTRADVDLVFLEVTADKSRDGVTLELFGRALSSLALRLFPDCSRPVDAVTRMLAEARR